MIRNYFKIAFRNIKKHKAYSFINITGLAIGMACCILILLWVQDELSYDRFHERADSIYRVAVKGLIGTNEVNQVACSAPLAATLVSEYPEVLQAARIWKLRGESLIRYQDNTFMESGFLWADQSLFDVFTIPMIQGDLKTALTLPNSVVLTESSAHKYFRSENPIGKTILFEGDLALKITGIVKDMPRNSHFHFDFLGSLVTLRGSRSQHWLNHHYFTYIVLEDGFPPDRLEAKFPDFIRKYVAPLVKKIMGFTVEEFYASGQSYDYYLQPLTSIHLQSNATYELGTNSDSIYVYIFSTIALFILLISCINFMNLATARSARRAKEVGMRKVLGSFRSQLIRQFLTESIFMCFVAIFVAVLLVRVSLPAFTELSGKELTLTSMENWILIPAFICLAFITGILSGIYPAFFLTSFQPVNVLKGRLKTGMKGSFFRSGLVVFQFVTSIVLFIGTFVVYGQLNYVQNTRLGFDKEHVIALKNASIIGKNHEAFKNEVLQHSSILSASFTNTLPGKIIPGDSFRSEGASEEEILTIWECVADYDLDDVLKLEMASGRYFSPKMPTDSPSNIIINETAVKILGLKDPISKNVILLSNPPRTYSIIGVVKDFHYKSFHRIIQPMAIFLSQGSQRYFSVRIFPENLPETLAFLENKWKEHVPGRPFEYFFLDKSFNSLYAAEQRAGKIFSIFSALAIIIACLGLFGLSSFTAEQRTKEIGIRKVFGAPTNSIVGMLSYEFVKRVLLASLIAAPIAYYFMNFWLQHFAYKTKIQIWMFLLSAILAILIAFLTVSYQTIKAAAANPVDSLRYE